MKRLRVWWPGYHMICYPREFACDATPVACELARLGIDCSPSAVMPEDFDLAFISEGMDGNGNLQERHGNFGGRPVCEYNWDLYPYTVCRSRDKRHLERLKTCHTVLVPSRCSVENVQHFTGRDAQVVRCAVTPYPRPRRDDGYVLDPLRKGYPDRNRAVVKEVCAELGIGYYESNNAVPLEEFRNVVAGARLIVSAPEYASTGGLTLLEGYALGIPVLLSDSPRNGIADYFGPPGARPGASYFRWNDRADLKAKVRELWHNPPQPDAQECLAWVQEEFGPERMARELAEVFRRMTGEDECAIRKLN